MKESKGITLIALVITIIVLLILAGVTIAMLTGNNGILSKANKVKEENPEIKAKEEIQLVLNEWQIEKRTGTKTIEEFLQAKMDSKEIDKYEEVEEKYEIYRDGYYLVIDSDGKIVEELKKFAYQTEATYEIISNNEGRYQISISMQNQAGIQKVTCLEEKVVEGNNETSVSFNYEIEGNNTYEFIIQTSQGEEKVVLDATDLSTQSIEITEVGGEGVYPVLYDNGVRLGEKVVTIQYPENTKGYYSKDNGVTWIEYDKEIVIDSDITLKAKCQINGKITQVVSKSVSCGLAGNALGTTAYNGNLNNSFNLGANNKTWYLKVDSSAIGKTIKVYGVKQVTSSDSRHIVFFYNSELTLLSSYDLTWAQGTPTSSQIERFKSFVVPQGCAWIGFNPGAYGGAIYNITY